MDAARVNLVTGGTHVLLLSVRRASLANAGEVTDAGNEWVRERSGRRGSGPSETAWSLDWRSQFFSSRMMDTAVAAAIENLVFSPTTAGPGHFCESANGAASGRERAGVCFRPLRCRTCSVTYRSNSGR